MECFGVGVGDSGNGEAHDETDAGGKKNKGKLQFQLNALKSLYSQGRGT